jgi:adenylate cyclase
VIAGNVGTDERKQYSISGNTVIMASRIEQLNKTYKSQLLLSQETLDKVDTATIEPVLLGNVELRGREEPVEIWKLK